MSQKTMLGSSSGNWDRSVGDWGVHRGAPSALSPIPVGTGCCQTGRAGPTNKSPPAQGHVSLPLWALAEHRGTKFIPNHNCHLCRQLRPWRMCWK